MITAAAILAATVAGWSLAKVSQAWANVRAAEILSQALGDLDRDVLALVDTIHDEQALRSLGIDIPLTDSGDQR